MIGPCMCGSPDCPSCGGAMGTYRSPMTMYDVFGILTVVKDHLQSAIDGTLDKDLAQDAVKWASDMIDEFGLCEACEQRPAEPGETMCGQCNERAAEAAYERYVNDGETFRGGEAAAFEAEEQERIQRELKR